MNYCPECCWKSLVFFLADQDLKWCWLNLNPFTLGFVFPVCCPSCHFGAGVDILWKYHLSHTRDECVSACVCVKARTIERHFYMKSSCISQRQTLRQIELPMRPVPISAAWKYELMNKDWCFFPPTWMKVIEDEQT